MSNYTECPIATTLPTPCLTSAPATVSRARVFVDFRQASSTTSGTLNRGIKSPHAVAHTRSSDSSSIRAAAEHGSEQATSESCS